MVSINPQLLALDPVPEQAGPRLAQHLRRLERLEVKMVHHRVEVVAVCHGRGVGREHVEQPVQVLLAAVRPVPEIGKPGDVHLQLGIHPLDGRVGGLEETPVVLDRPGPRLPGVARLPHVGLVPDDPVPDAAPVVLRHSPCERGPRIHIGNRPRAVLGPQCRPSWRADQDGDDLPPDRQLGRYERIRHIRGFPVGRAVRLDHVPPQDDARVSRPGCGCSLRVDKCLDDAEAGIGGKGFRRRRQDQATQGDKDGEGEDESSERSACSIARSVRDQNSNLLKASANSYPGFSPASLARWRMRSASFSGSDPIWLTCCMSAASRCSMQQLMSSQ